MTKTILEDITMERVVNLPTVVRLQK